MTAVVKKSVFVLVVAFLVFYLVTAPAASAEAVRSGADALGTGASAILTFFRQLSAG